MSHHGKSSGEPQQHHLGLVSNVLCSRVHEQFEQQVEQSPQAIAVQWGDKTFTYEALNRRANQIARYLRTKSPQSGELLVGLCVQRSFEMIAAVFGILKAGGGYLPLDPNYPQDRLALMIDDAKPSVILTQDSVEAMLPPCTAEVVCLDGPEIVGQESGTNLGDKVATDSLAYIIYTSGSTGRPKGVMIEQGALASFVASATRTYGIGSSDRVLQFASISFDVAAEEIYPCLLAGGTLVLQTPEMMSSVSTFLKRCGDRGVTILDLPTAFWHVMTAELCADPDLSFPSSIRSIIFGGEAVNPERVRQWQQRFVKQDPPIQLINAYGPTETTVDAIVYAIPNHAGLKDVYTSTPIGKPLSGVTTYILDEQHQQVPAGDEGELYIGGAHLARGYLYRPELTAERFIPNPFGEGRLYKTGDWCRERADGNIEYLGRIDSQVKIRGFRVELGEIESVLLEQPGVQEAAVVVNQSSDQHQLVAYVVMSESECFNRKLLQTALQQKLPSYMLPSTFVELGALPLTPSDKVDRKSLAACSVVLQQGDVEVDDQRTKPETETEVALANLWQASLSNVVGDLPLGVNDNFFELGGTSLMAVKLFSQIEKKFGQQIQLSTLFEAPTIRELARYLEGHQETSAPMRSQCSVIPLKTSGDRPPFFFLNSGVYARQFVPLLSDSQPLYNLNLFNIAQEFTALETLSLSDVAKTFIADMRSAQPQGPYYIGGFCADSKLAAEMAHQLQAQGETTGLLLMIDPTWDEPLTHGKLQSHLKRLLALGPRYLVEIFKDIRANLFQSAEEEVKLQAGVSSTIQAVDIEIDIEIEEDRRWMPVGLQEVTLLRQYEELCLQFQPHPYQGKAAVIFSKEAAKDPRDLLASRLEAGFDEYVLPGLHLTIFEEPSHRKQLVAVIEQALGRALEQAAEPVED